MGFSAVIKNLNDNLMLGGLLKINVANTLNVYSAGEKDYDMIWAENRC